MSLLMYYISLVAATTSLGIVIGIVVRPLWLVIICSCLTGLACAQLWDLFLLPKVHI